MPPGNLISSSLSKCKKTHKDILTILVSCRKCAQLYRLRRSNRRPRRFQCRCFLRKERKRIKSKNETLREKDIQRFSCLCILDEKNSESDL